jgi:energy-coupling factor transport system substrate-specific component|tara:strand:- start:25 stop:642 length:618 start_codon:yes stop_codon:yes gene_type:complete
MLAINIAMLSLIGWALWRAEQKMSSGSDLILLILLGAFAVSGRVLLDPIPNVQPVTVIVLLAGIHFGAPRAVALAAAVALCSNVLLGHGLWSLYQAVGWSAVGVAGAALSNRLYVDGRMAIGALAALAAVSAFAFDWIVSLSALHSLSSEVFLVYLMAGIPYDLLHAAGNVAFVAWLANPLSEIMTRHVALPAPMAVRDPVSSRV